MDINFTVTLSSVKSKYDTTSERGVCSHKMRLCFHVRGTRGSTPVKLTSDEINYNSDFILGALIIKLWFQWEQLMEIGAKEPDTQLDAILKTIAVNECCTIVYTVSKWNNLIKKLYSLLRNNKPFYELYCRVEKKITYLCMTYNLLNCWSFLNLTIETLMSQMVMRRNY